MFERLKSQPEDPILAMMEAFRADPRTDKIDLGIGIYRDAAGTTPVMHAVKTAERQLVESQTTKSYTALSGDPAFIKAMAGLVLGDRDMSRIAGAATVGGTGAIRQGLDLVRLARPDARVHIPDPSWPNHRAIIQAVGLTCASYRYFDAETGGVDIDGMIADLSAVRSGDVVLLHGCCHNPTGADPNAADWHRIIATLAETGATVLVDLAYLGFGDGLDTDAEATRQMVDTLPEVIIGVSCSKNFGLYRDRAGVVLVSAPDADQARVVQGNLTTLNRLAYSFPADHGARTVEMILNDSALRADWSQQLSQMRGRINTLRQALATALRDRTGSDRYAFLGSQRGMFSRLPASPDEIRILREEHGIYLIGDGRMNIAGLSQEDIPRLAQAIATVCA
ncbi:aromatic amino acid transaminase [Pseudooceanicola nitratireducens]|uniref:amino acid aminotransferase n=1 Tax=Pseudooceanicola nitratireducens TaxID=517719 RepID=UPI003C7A1542